MRYFLKSSNAGEMVSFMEVRALLKEKTQPVYIIASNQTVADAVRLMNDISARALIVTENNQPVGIFAERDLFRFFQKKPQANISETALHLVMTNKLICAKPEDDIDYVISMMIKADINHLPVIEDRQVIAMLSLKDLTEHQLEFLREEVQQLKDYIDDLHEAGKD